MTVRDRAKSRIREAGIVGGAVAAAALSVGVAVAATSPTFMSAPGRANVPVAVAELAPPPAQVKGYTILRSSSLVMDTPTGLRILFGTGMRVTGLPDLETLVERQRMNGAHGASAIGRTKAAPASPVAAPAPAAATAPAEPDFPGRGEEFRSDKADPQRSQRAEQQAAVLADAEVENRGRDDRGRDR